MTDQAHELWDSCARELQEQVARPVWLTYFDPVQPVSVDDGHLVLSVPSTIVRDRLESKYASLLAATLGEIDPHLAVRFVVVAAEPSTDELDDLPHPSRLEVPTASDPVGDDLDLDLDLGSLEPEATPASDAMAAEQTFETFITGGSNQFAHAAALSVAETPGRSYNPLTIYGPSGVGKTHLLHAIGNYVAQNYATYTVRYVRTELFLYQFVDAIRNNTANDFKRRYREIDVLLVDDIQFLEGREGLQEEFFHTFNALHEARKQIVLTSDRPPDALATLEERLRSRFVMGLVTDIQPPEVETRLAILRMKAEEKREDRGIDVPDEVLDFIATNVKTNIRELEGALTRLTAFVSLRELDCTLDVAEEVLGPILGDIGPKPITVDRILSTTSELFDVPVEDIIGQSRRRQLVTARQVAMYVTRELTNLSYPAIADHFGNRDHTTIMHAVKKVENLMAERHQLYDQVTELIETLKTES